MGGAMTPGHNSRDPRWKLKMQGVNDNRKALIASMKVQGYTIRQMLDKFEQEGVVNPVTGKRWSMGIVSKDMKELTEEWRKATMKDINTWKTQELEKIDQIEREAWRAWNRGIGKKQRTTQEKMTGGKSGGGTKASIVTEDLNGDPRYLAVMLDCQNRRAKLMGLDEPGKTEHSGKGGGPIEVSDAERVAKIEALILSVDSRQDEK
jgi:hypothetical protein